MDVQRWHGVHQGLVPDDDGPLVKFEDVQKRIEALEGVLMKFAHPNSTGRSPDGGETHPEKDIMSVRVEMKTWFRMKILLGEMDVESVKMIMPSSRPSEEFIQELKEYENEI